MRVKHAFFKCVFVIVIMLPSVPLLAQQSFNFADSLAPLPDDPSRAQAAAQSPAIYSQQEGGATLSGTVVDKQGAVLQGAQVMLSGPAGSPARTLQSGSDGQFEFKDLPPNAYKLTVTAPGMITFTSSDILLRAGEFHILPPVSLSITPVTTSVTVSGNSKKLSEEQVHIAEQQRSSASSPIFIVLTIGTRRRCWRNRNSS